MGGCPSFDRWMAAERRRIKALPEKEWYRADDPRGIALRCIMNPALLSRIVERKTRKDGVEVWFVDGDLVTFIGEDRDGEPWITSVLHSTRRVSMCRKCDVDDAQTRADDYLLEDQMPVKDRHRYDAKMAEGDEIL